MTYPTPMGIAEAEDQECGSCLGERRIWVHSQDPQDDYEVPCPECNAGGDGFSKSELANIDRIRRQNAKHWRNTWGDDDRLSLMTLN